MMKQPTTPIIFDANVLIAWCTAKDDSDQKKRLRYLLQQADNSSRRIIIPTPAMAEFLVRADDASIGVFQVLEKSARVYVAAFDRRAAFECSLLDGAALNRGDKRDGSAEPYQKIKIDRQIIAIAKALSAGLVVAEDEGVRRLCRRVGLEAKTIAELDLPPEPPQQRLALPDPEPEKDAELSLETGASEEAVEGVEAETSADPALPVGSSAETAHSSDANSTDNHELNSGATVEMEQPPPDFGKYG